MDLRTEYEWKEDPPSQTVSHATVWKAKQVSRNIYEVNNRQIQHNTLLRSLHTGPCPNFFQVFCVGTFIPVTSGFTIVQMEKLADGSANGLMIYRISLQAWYALISATMLPPLLFHVADESHGKTVCIP